MQHGPRFKPHPRSAPGDFYVEDGCCLACGVPHVVAPDLLGWVDTRRRHCFWIKQPETPEELARAIEVLQKQEVGCHRYAGSDLEVLQRISPENCDYPLKPANSRVDIASAPRSVEFAALDCGASRISKLWKKITGT
jgi:hypothetical protein